MSKDPILNIFSDKEKLAEKLASDLLDYLGLLLNEKEQVYIALSGGSTPKALFHEFTKYVGVIEWDKIKFFWVDERCVPPDNSESNYGAAKTDLIDPLGLSSASVFRIKGENDPADEANAYGELILDIVSPELTFPVFDIVLLGMGEDGHTASIFPNQIHLWNEEKLCVVGTHPLSGQKRVSFTGHLINAANRIIFMVTGENKAGVVHSVIKKENNFEQYPASLVSPPKGRLEWYLDQEAASMLD